MEKLFMFNLQLFAEEVKEEAQPDIPAELEGVSESVAREVMAELPKEESSDDHAEEAEGSTTQEEATQEDTQAQQEAPQEVQESQEAQDGHADTDGDKKAGKVPYERFKDVNDKYRSAEQEAQTLRRQLEELQRQQQASGQAQQTQQQAQAQQQEQQQQEIPMDLLNKAYEVAKKQVLAQLNLSEEDYSDLEYQDDGEKAKVDRAIRFSFDSICQQARERAKDLAAQKQQEQLIMQKAYSDYESMAAEEQKRSDFNDIWQYATTTHFTSMPVYAQAVIQNAFNCVNSGVGTLEQVQLVKDYYNTAKQAYLSGSGSGQAPQQQATNNKVKQMTTAPRVDKVRGTPSTGGMTIQEIERMVNGDWGKVPDDLKKQILAGRLS
ncbi:hypothetical protein HMPREF3191_00879 [Veillonellaceae bacterium DNF00626]|nr:hypothetical protein HMPREF3191_00879 [Veillonellaceae bacterium DNF00626]